MKKNLVLVLVLILSLTNCEAKDYAKNHMKQMKKNQEYRINNTYFADYSEIERNNIEIKDPKLIKLKGYEEVSEDKLKQKSVKDEIEYAKIYKFLSSRKVNEYYMQAYSEDFYRVYRITEKIIRANGLDFINWRLTIDSQNVFNAYNSQTNCITINAGALDTLKDNDDALALLISHEIAHGIMGHSKRKAKYIAKINRAKRMLSYTAYRIALKRYNKASREMEFEADIEGAKLAAKAGYNLSEAKETLSYMNTLQDGDEWNSTHPNTDKRLKNFEQNKKYFFESEWKKVGEYNLYNSEVLKCEKSSNRNSIIISRSQKNSSNANYIFETIEDMYLRYAYKSYLNGNFKEAIKYFKDYLICNKSDYVVYLYISYAYEYLYKQTGKGSFLESAKEFAEYSKKLAPKNKYVLEQVLAL